MKESISCAPEVATGTKLAAGITDKRGYAARWGFSIRHIDNLLAQGCPHLKIGKRRVRLVVTEADEWMKRTFATQRRRPARTSATVGVK
jgi:hypothetical protein